MRLRKFVIQFSIGVALICSVVVIGRSWTSFLPISDEEIERQIVSVSSVFTAQYAEIRQYFPEHAQAIRDEAERLERLRRRGIHIPQGSLWTASRDLMAPTYRAARHASEDALDTSLATLLEGYAIFRGHPQCGNFLLDGTSAITVAERTQYYSILAADVPVHFEAVRGGVSAPEQRGVATGDDWHRLFELHLSEGHSQSDIADFTIAHREGIEKSDIDMPKYCEAFFEIMDTLVGARFEGSAEIKAGFVISGFGISE